MKQQTIARPFKISGPGIHSGKEASASFFPAGADHGIVFFKGGEKIPATLNSVKETRRGTTLAGIAVVEHLLSSAYALGIDNLKIEVEGEEIPALDGSALPFVSAFFDAGIIELPREKLPITISAPLSVSSGQGSLIARPFHGFKVVFMVNFPGAGEQRFSFDLGRDAYAKEIAPARTFGYLEEYALLKEQGLALGASMENALVLDKGGYVNKPRFPDELVRHKILDLIGDLALLGSPVEGEFIAEMSGHKLNIELARRIIKNAGTGH